MLKFIFWSLLSINAALFAYGQGYLGNFKGNEHEPARMKNQLNPDKLSVITSAQAHAAASAALQAAEDAKLALKKPDPIPCTEVGNFPASDAARFELQLAALNLGDHQSRQNITTQDVTSHIVFIPPQGSKEGADKKVGELKDLGVTNYFIMSENTTMRWAISLGVFKSESAAQNLLAALVKQGVHSAKIAPRGAISHQLSYQFRDLDVGTKAQLDEIVAAYPAQEMHACK